MKKGKILGLFLIPTLLMTGCIDAMPELTEEQSAIIAEYSASLLLKYSPNFEYRIADEEELLEAMSVETTDLNNIISIFIFGYNCHIRIYELNFLNI